MDGLFRDIFDTTKLSGDSGCIWLLMLECVTEIELFSMASLPTRKKKSKLIEFNNSSVRFDNNFDTLNICTVDVVETISSPVQLSEMKRGGKFCA